MHELRRVSNDEVEIMQMISYLALATQSYLITEAENDKLNSGTEVFESLVEFLKCSINRIGYKRLVSVPVEVLQVKYDYFIV